MVFAAQRAQPLRSMFIASESVNQALSDKDSAACATRWLASQLDLDRPTASSG